MTPILSYRTGPKLVMLQSSSITRWAGWLQACDIEQTRSGPHQKNDQAHAESKNNHVFRKHAFYWRYDTTEELKLLNRLWWLVSLRLNFFTCRERAASDCRALVKATSTWVEVSSAAGDLSASRRRIPSIEQEDHSG